MARAIFSEDLQKVLNRANEGSAATAVKTSNSFSGSVRSVNGVSSFQVGDVFVIPQNYTVFEEKIRNSDYTAEYTNVPVIEGPSRGKVLRFYPSMLTKRVDEYKTEGAEYMPTGTSVFPKGTAAEAFQACEQGSIAESMRVIVDKGIKVSDRKRVPTMFGTNKSTTTVFSFDFAD